jgi:hypothetical protein
MLYQLTIDVVFQWGKFCLQDQGVSNNCDSAKFSNLVLSFRDRLYMLRRHLVKIGFAFLVMTRCNSVLLEKKWCHP